MIRKCYFVSNKGNRINNEDKFQINNFSSVGKDEMGKKIILNKILKDTVVQKAILFGSYARNCPTETSDIDLIIDSDGQLLNIRFYGLLEELVEQLNKKIDLFEISEIQKDSAIYKNIQKEGVVIYEK